MWLQRSHFPGLKLSNLFGRADTVVTTACCSWGKYEQQQTSSRQQAAGKQQQAAASSSCTVQLNTWPMITRVARTQRRKC